MRRLAVVATAVAVAVTPLPSGHAAAAPDCSMMTATPAPSPLVVWCATTTRSATTGQPSGVRLWRSAGDGRWVEAKAANVSVNAVPAPPQVSPRWAADRTLYWVTSSGLYASRDLGDSFDLVTPLVTGSDHPIRRALLRDVGGTVHVAVAGADRTDVGFEVRGGVAHPAIGSPDEDLTFVGGPDGVAVLAWDTATTEPHRVVGYRCTDLLVCAVPWFRLDESSRWSQQLSGAWRRPGAAATEPTYIAVRSGDQFARVSLVRASSRVASSPAADAAIAALSDGRNAPLVTIAFRGSQVVLRVISWADRRSTRHDRLYTSDDHGSTWRLAVAAATDARERSTGPPGWRPGAVSLSFVPALEIRGDVWLVNASDGRGYTLRCSRDRGRRWRATCT